MPDRDEDDATDDRTARVAEELRALFAEAGPREVGDDGPTEDVQPDHLSAVETAPVAPPPAPEPEPGSPPWTVPDEPEVISEPVPAAEPRPEPAPHDPFWSRSEPAPVPAAEPGPAPELAPEPEPGAPPAGAEVPAPPVVAAEPERELPPVLAPRAAPIEDEAPERAPDATWLPAAGPPPANVARPGPERATTGSGALRSAAPEPVGSGRRAMKRRPSLAVVRMRSVITLLLVVAVSGLALAAAVGFVLAGLGLLLRRAAGT